MVISFAFISEVVQVVIVCGCGAMSSPIVLDIENKSISSADGATLLSVYAMFGDLTSKGVNIIIGKTADISTTSTFITCAAMCVCDYALLLVYKKKESKKINVEGEIY